MFRKRLGCRKSLAGTEGAGVQFGPQEASSPTLCDPMDSRPLGSSVHGIFQARTLKWVAISFSRDFSSEQTENQR